MRVLGVGTPQSPARAGSAAQRDKPDEMLWLRQRPPRHLGVQMLVCSERPRSLARVEQREGETGRPPPLPPRQFPPRAKCEGEGKRECMRRAGWRTGPPDQANAPIALQKPSCSNTAAFVKRLPGGRQGIVVVLLLSGAIAWGVWGSRRIERQANSVAADVSAATAHTPSPGKKVMQTNAESAPTTPITAAGNAIFRFVQSAEARLFLDMSTGVHAVYLLVRLAAL